MKISILGRLDTVTNTHAVGGAELITALLSKGLAARGHRVSLFVTEGSEDIDGVDVIPVIKTPYFDLLQKMQEVTEVDRKTLFATLMGRSLLSFFQKTADADVVHAHLAVGVFSGLADLFPCPVVSTLHLPPSFRHWELPKLYTTPTIHHVALSKYELSQASFAKDYVYNGIDISDNNLNEENEDGYLWIGKISRDAAKGLPIALDVTKTLKKELTVLGSNRDTEYYTQEIVPRLHELVKNLGFVTHEQKMDAYAHARALLYPIEWEEPFGLVFIEAMSVGTPVIAFAKGAVPELIVDGVTGFIVNPSDTDIRGNFLIKSSGMNGIIEAMEKLENLPESEYREMRRACRKQVEEQFTYQKMCEAYESIYQRVTS